jgi:hypothetical protein
LPLVYLPGINNFLLLYVANTAVAAMFVRTFCLILVVSCNSYIVCYLIMNNSLFALEKRMVIWEVGVKNWLINIFNNVNMFTGIGEASTSPLHILLPHYKVLFQCFF